MNNTLLDTSPVEEVLISLLKKNNNVVITTKCNLNCVFCSRKFNPFQTECSHKDFNFIKSQIKLLEPNSQILINNAISRLTDGEPFTHPRIWDALKMIRKKFPYHNSSLLGDKIQITTNGTFLTKENLKRLNDLGGIVIVHSINTTNKNKWKELTRSNDKLADIAINVPDLVKDYNITYISSIVALPELVGWEDIENTIRDLDQKGVGRLRMFSPTYTKYASKEEQDKLKCDREKLLNLVLKLKKELKIKILCYPFYRNDLTPYLEGYEDNGLLPTDEILSVNGSKIFSSFHAQQALLNKTTEMNEVILKRNGAIKTITVDSKKISLLSYTDARINYDVDFYPSKVVRAVGDCRRVLVLMSEAGSLVVRRAFEKCVDWVPVLKDKEFFFHTVKSRFYGGSVVCAGLLMCSDYREAVKEFLGSGGVRPDLILVSENSFDPLGRDLLKNSIYDLSDELNIPIKWL